MANTSTSIKVWLQVISELTADKLIGWLNLFKPSQLYDYSIK